jgi:hypothetical protein
MQKHNICHSKAISPVSGHSGHGTTVSFQATPAITAGNPDDMSRAPPVATPRPQQKYPQLRTSSAFVNARSVEVCIDGSARSQVQLATVEVIRYLPSVGRREVP